MADYIKSYLQNSTAHGFRYLVFRLPGNGGAFGHWYKGVAHPTRNPRVLWALAIVLSLTASVALVCSSIRETSRRPVLTTTDYIPIQVSLVSAL